jgi:hypothetical protein
MASPKRILLLAIPVLLLIFFSLTYIPHKLFHMAPSSVSKISVFDGNTGKHIEITERDDIQHILDNLNRITFHKGKLSIGYMGYSFKITVYNNKGKAINRFIINSTDTIRYKGFFYKAHGKPIDYEYIKKLYDKYPIIGP